MGDSTSSISGLMSGIDTATLVTKLMQIESRPQVLLKSQLTTAQTMARALREINTSMATLSSAAQALTATGAFDVRTVSSTTKDVTATATANARAGSSVTFTVTALAAAQTSLSGATWSSPNADVRTATADSTHAPPAWPLTVLGADGTVVDTIDLPAGATLEDAADAINKKGIGLSATVLRLDSTHYRLQVTSTATGTSNGFTLRGDGEDDASAGSAFRTLVEPKDAELTIGDMTARSPNNTFTELLSGVSVTVSQLSGATPTTVSVGTDNGAITAKVQALINAATTALTTIAKYTENSPGSTAPLRGNSALNRMAGQIRDQLTRAVDGKSPALGGVQLSRDGALTFDAAKLGALLQSDPALAQKMFGGTTGVGPDGVRNTPDDTVDVDGLAARLLVLGKQASDSATGMITSMAEGQDTRAKNLQKQVDGWDLRLQQRQQLLTSKFKAMESTLGTLKSQSAWLASQINALPSWNANKK